MATLVDPPKNDKDSSLYNLSFEQTQRVARVLSEDIKITPRQENYPTLTVSPLAITRLIRKHLVEKGISVNEVQFKGSGASFCLVDDSRRHPAIYYNDLDIGFQVKLRSEFEFFTIREEVLNSLLHFFPEETPKNSITSFMLQNTYVNNMVKICNDENQWSLVSLGGESGMSIEFTFVHQIERQYKFSIDSFHISLDPMLSFLDASDIKSLMQAGPDSIPRVHAICLYGNHSEALDHLNKRLICTNSPEQIRGGGLLKYCSLRVTGFKPVNGTVETLESTMSTRFLRDFPVPEDQYRIINQYLITHYPPPGELANALNFLEVLMGVSSSSQCEMKSRRHLIEITNEMHSKVLSLLPPPHSGPCIKGHPNIPNHPAPHSHHLGPHDHPSPNSHLGPQGSKCRGIAIVSDKQQARAAKEEIQVEAELEEPVTETMDINHRLHDRLIAEKTISRVMNQHNVEVQILWNTKPNILIITGRKKDVEDAKLYLFTCRMINAKSLNHVRSKEYYYM